MNTNLKRMTQEWMQLERKTLKQRQEADSFYEKNLMKLIEQDYKKRNKGKLIGTTDYLIMSVGTSYEPLVLNISLMKPKRILFLYTDISEKTLAKIVEYCHLPADQYEKSRVDESDPLTIYREIKESYLGWKNRIVFILILQAVQNPWRQRPQWQERLSTYSLFTSGRMII